MGEWTRDTPWRQGHVLEKDAATALGLIHPDFPDDSFVMVATHDCDLAALPDKEPFVEVMIGRVIASLGAASHAKVSRQLQIELESSSGKIVAEFLATAKAQVKKEDLAAHMPNSGVGLDAQGRVIFQRWLSARYRRAAFPDEFERRLKKKRKVEKALAESGHHVIAIFFDVDDGEDADHSASGDPYTLGIYLLYGTSTNEAEASIQAQAAAERIESEFEKAFKKFDGQWEDIQLEYCEAISDSAMTYRDSLMFKQWRLDHISLDNAPHQPMLEE